MTDSTVFITIIGGSITGSAVQTNMSMPGKAFSYLFIIYNHTQQEKHVIDKRIHRKSSLHVIYKLARHVKQRDIPVREAIFESVTIDGVPSDNRSGKPIKTKPKL